jgi:SAM-dependent methyltransferase
VRTATTDFNQFADSYDRALSEALAATGEDVKFFAQERVNWFASCVRELESAANRILDYGCGIGTTAPLLLEAFAAATVVGVDLSERLRYFRIQEYRPDGTCDMAYCNGVFHHIPPKERSDALRFIWDSLRPGGLFGLWENNPWNPGTRYVMAHCAFDGDAIALTPPEARRLLRSAGFEILRNDFLFIFPRALKWLRPAEKLVTKVPIGAQYLLLCRKSAS